MYDDILNSCMTIAHCGKGSGGSRSILWSLHSIYRTSYSINPLFLSFFNLQNIATTDTAANATAATSTATTKTAATSIAATVTTPSAQKTLT